MEVQPTSFLSINPIERVEPRPQLFEDRPTQEEAPPEDRLDLHDGGPRVFFQVVEDRVEEVGGERVRQEVVEERVEAPGQEPYSIFHTLRQQLTSIPREAEDAAGQLDPNRIRELLFDG